ncbi:MAG: SoxR reducing system RseC family protein [Thermodesulfovibrionales bacterium]
MIEEIGTVKSTTGMMAIVSVPKKSACQGCTAGTCKPDEQSMEIEAVNHVGAVAGQRVRVAIKSFAYMKGSMVVYGLPAVGLVLGAVLGKEVLSGFIKGIDPDILSAVVGFAVFGIALVMVKIWSNTLGNKLESKPVIEEIVER